ncbi:putative conserved membrane protein [Synechococcus sp. RS9909]|uniref:hypothetical protein n=1 Tax=unclassified Synechococcus TaxID=2626047 RepID=UPI00006907EE|nr:MULTISPECIES: hypothetical protein [unclassified Synechococcus]EAQ70128.1 hypothetical protein RS9917_04815 [Synechococcus sp. RS9917]QNI78216.1 putative conserved membrane protein [Synechococcus sp. RS9909]
MTRQPLILLVCAAFALRALSLIEATGLWSDELYTVGKSFQPSLAAMLAMLRQDTHPPLYYGLLWGWGQLLPPSGLTLRLFSWLAYLAGGVLITAQSRALARDQAVGGARPSVAMALAALLAFCSPYPVRFAIEGKGYALLVLLVALAWWWRRAGRPGLYGLAVALAACTHYYGLFLFAAAAVWDGWQRRWRLAWAAALALLPALGWIALASAYLMRSGTGAWIGRPDFALLEDTLARGLGLWPLPKLALLGLAFWAIRRWGVAHDGAGQRWQQPALADRSGLMPSLWMVLAVVLVSFWKPLAFSRYFVVLIPALIPWLAVQVAAWRLNRRGAVVGAAALVGLLLSWWWHSFQELDPAVNGHGTRESDDFQLLSQRLGDAPDRFSRRERLLNLSDRIEVAAGRMPAPSQPWRDAASLNVLLERDNRPRELWLADSGNRAGVAPRLKPLKRRAEAAGYHCERLELASPYAQALRCTLDPGSAQP